MHTGGGVDLFEASRRHGVLLAAAVRTWRDIQNRLTPPPTLTSSITVQQERILDKVLIALHKAQLYLVKDLRSGGALKDYQYLPRSVGIAITRSEYGLFCKCLMALSSVRSVLAETHCTIQDAFQDVETFRNLGYGAAKPPADQEQAPPYQIPSSAFEELDGLHWDVNNFCNLSKRELPWLCLDDLLCRHFDQGLF